MTKENCGASVVKSVSLMVLLDILPARTVTKFLKKMATCAVLAASLSDNMSCVEMELMFGRQELPISEKGLVHYCANLQRHMLCLHHVGSCKLLWNIGTALGAYYVNGIILDIIEDVMFTRYLQPALGLPTVALSKSQTCICEIRSLYLS